MRLSTRNSSVPGDCMLYGREPMQAVWFRVGKFRQAFFLCKVFGPAGLFRICASDGSVPPWPSGSGSGFSAWQHFEEKQIAVNSWFPGEVGGFVFPQDAKKCGILPLPVFQKAERKRWKTSARQQLSTYEDIEAWRKLCELRGRLTGYNSELR